MLWFLLGILLGGAISLVIAGVLVRRGVVRAREAERRALGAERMAELGGMTSGLAHEIKNPLSTIGLNAQLLAEAIEDSDLDPDDKHRLVRRIGTLHRETDRLRDILDDFLQFAGELRLHIEPVDLNVLVAELIDFLSPQVEREGVRLRSELCPGELIMPVDAGRLKQALLNLMLNAVQAMAGTDAAQRELIVRTSTDGADALIHVIDTGGGMDDATMARIFEPYFSTKSGGSGLGLPTTRRIVEAHGGRLEVHSEPGRGTDFAVVLETTPGKRS